MSPAIKKEVDSINSKTIDLDTLGKDCFILGEKVKFKATEKSTIWRDATVRKRNPLEVQIDGKNSIFKNIGRHLVMKDKVANLHIGAKVKQKIEGEWVSGTIFPGKTERERFFQANYWTKPIKLSSDLKIMISEDIIKWTIDYLNYHKGVKPSKIEIIYSPFNNVFGYHYFQIR
jgi:hypothetical protein